MPKVMLINVTHAEESRVGIVADGVLASFEIETFSREHLKGNIYKGVVHRIHPALEAAFVDIGADRDAFLPLDEICFRNLPAPPPREAGNGGERRRPRIKDILKPSEEVLVQIVKEEFGNKPPTLSTFYSLPGRYLVLLPGSDDAGISRKIEGAERTRIRELIERLQPPEGFGIIIRTAAGYDEGARELHRDMTYLLRLWETIRHAAASKRGPALVYREHDLVLRNIRDYFTPDIDEIHIDNEDVFQRAREFLHEVMPGKEAVLHLYQGDQPIFSKFNVEAQIESIYKRRVPLKSGGSIVIDGTEALTAVDVNSGRSVRGSNQEDTAFRTNIEAAAEIARQLRLRDLGGLIVIDFIDMRVSGHITDVEKTLREAMREDKARHEIGRISQFGLLEISRQRLRPAAAATSYAACPMCEGYGLVRTTESAALVALRKIHNRVAQDDVAALRVSLPPDVAVYLLNQKRDDLAQLERRYGTRIQVVLNAALMPHQSEFEVRQRAEGERPAVPQIRLGGVATVEAAVEPAAGNNGSAATAAAPTEAAAGGKRRRRRRGRRRGRGRQAAAALGEVFAGLAAGTALAQDASEPALALPAEPGLTALSTTTSETLPGGESAQTTPPVPAREGLPPTQPLAEQGEAPPTVVDVPMPEGAKSAAGEEPHVAEVAPAKPSKPRRRSRTGTGSKRTRSRAKTTARSQKPQAAETPSSEKAAPARGARRRSSTARKGARPRAASRSRRTAAVPKPDDAES